MPDMVRKFFLLISLCIWPLLWFFNSLSTDRTVLIFGATTIFDTPMWNDQYVQQTCSRDISRYCSFTNDPKSREVADAWIYHNADYDETTFSYGYNGSKTHIWYSQESPTSIGVKVSKNIINWTMNYRQDSDFFVPYGGFAPISPPETHNYGRIWTMKKPSLTSAWMVSNCNAPSRRNDVIKALQKAGLSIDVYGNCRDFSSKSVPNCPRTHADRNRCPASTIGQYYFYFALENSNCVDYVTEKFFNSLDYYKSVPIVMKRKIYDDLKFPNKTFIALDDFPTYTEFIAFLSQVKGNKEQYLSYQTWRNHYKIDYPSQIICKICERLNNRHLEPVKNRTKLTDWYDKKTNCDNDYALRFH